MKKLFSFLFILSIMFMWACDPIDETGNNRKIFPIGISGTNVCPTCPTCPVDPICPICCTFEKVDECGTKIEANCIWPQPKPCYYRITCPGTNPFIFEDSSCVFKPPAQ